jgi:threonine aldolase
MIDLRSDTVTKPTAEMRDAMAHAEVGDDVYGEDPSVNNLEKMAAQKMGKEAGLFVPSGTMGNLIAVLTHCQRGDEIILGSKSHTFYYEAGGVSALGGVMVHTIPNQTNGTLDLDDIRDAIRGNDVHFPTTRLILLENTQNKCGGVPISKYYTTQVTEIAKQNKLSTHMDGARIFNAAIKFGIPVKELVENIDSVTFCLSKGLSAPVGSVLCGSQSFIHNARRIRKQLGGGMRQAGILAAAGVVALETMINRLDEDHSRAKNLADGLSLLPEINLWENSPQTNMVFLDVALLTGNTIQDLKAKLRDQKVLVSHVSSSGLRLVTHSGISDSDIEETINAFKLALGLI